MEIKIEKYVRKNQRNKSEKLKLATFPKIIMSNFFFLDSNIYRNN